MIYGYLRVSSDEQDVNNQKSGVLAFAQQKGWVVDGWISDEGVSGVKDPEKRQLGKLMKKCKAGDTIVCSELSRLGRKMLMVMSILEYCMKNGIMIYTVKDNYVLGDNIQSTVLAFAFSLAAQIERDMISARTKEALAVRKKSGVLLGNPRCKQRQVANKEKVEKMIELAYKGYSASQIGKKLKIHRLTVSKYLSEREDFKGILKGFWVTFFRGKRVFVTRTNASNFYLNFDRVQSIFARGGDLSPMGIDSVEPSYYELEQNYQERVNISSHPLIDRKQAQKLVLQGLTIPEIHLKIAVGYDLDYNTVYDYIAEDTELSNEYRTRGHLRCKSPRKR